MDKNEITSMIEEAFKGVEYPGDWCLKGSDEGDEPYLLEEDFKGKNDWAKLDAKFLAQAPKGYGSALAFFSDEAFHFYIPAYMICDLKGELEGMQVYRCFTSGFDESSKKKYINPRRYGNRTWHDWALYKHSVFNEKEAKAVIAYLEIKKEEEWFDPNKKVIQDALKNYWYNRVKE